MADNPEDESYWAQVFEAEKKESDFGKLYANDTFGRLDRALTEYRYKRHSALYFVASDDRASYLQDVRALEEMRPRLVRRLRELADLLEKKL